MYDPNSMITAVIIDDELSAIKSLTWEIENFCSDVIIKGSFTNPEEAIAAINNFRPDCVFLDIEMPEMDGFQLLRKLKYRDFDLIITTAYDSYALKAFKENAIDYLLKPVDTDDLIKSIVKISTKKKNKALGFELQKVIGSINTDRLETKVSFPLSGKTIFVKPSDIIYCRADGNYSVVYLKGDKKEMISKKLKEIDAIISNDRFFRVHNSYLVNLNYIREYIKNDGHHLVLDNGTTIPVSRSRKDALLTFLNS